MLAGAGLAGGLALHALAHVLLRSAEDSLGRRGGPVVLTGAYLAGAAVLGTLAVRRLRATWQRGERALDDARAEVTSAVDAARS